MKKQMAKTILIATAGIGLFSGSALADRVFVYPDTWNTFPGYDIRSDKDTIGTHPFVDSLIVTTSNDAKYLKTVQVVLTTDRAIFDSLFITTNYNNTNWDSWDYFVHDGGTYNQSLSTGTLPGDGLWKVNQATYTLSANGRVGHPDGLDASGLEIVSNTFEPSFDTTTKTITYDFTKLLSLNNGQGLSVEGFFVAYSPYCANDVAGGGNPVPEPATMLLFGTGIAGLTGIIRRRKIN